MCDITKENFVEKFPHIENSLKKCKFLSIDLEFSALSPLPQYKSSLFDNNKERYSKLRKNLENVIPVQFGITAFQFDNDSNDYFGEVFNFYLAPSPFGSIDKVFCFQSSTLKFLCAHKFDFNKFAYSGIPYLNNPDEEDLRHQLENNTIEYLHLKAEVENVFNHYWPIVNQWQCKSQIGETLLLPELLEKYKHFHEIIYFIHKQLRIRFPNVWTYEHEGSFYVKKVSDSEIKSLLKNCNLTHNLINDLTGFSKVFRLIKSLRKPLIGHNLLQDLMIIAHNFESPLPESYSSYKKLINQVFPTIFDTKTLYYEIKRTMPKEQLPEGTSLEDLFTFFKDGAGRHLVANCNAIESNVEKHKIGKYHEAGWDSFCTGYIFIRMAYFNIAKDYPKSKNFVASEIISGLSAWRNQVNIIRGSTNHIRLDGEDPTSNRPSWFIVKSVRNEPLNIGNLTSLLSALGSFDVRKVTARGHQVLLAVDNFRTARAITNQLTATPGFKIEKYNFIRHSPHAHRALLLVAATLSGSLLLWLSQRR